MGWSTLQLILRKNERVVRAENTIIIFVLLKPFIERIPGSRAILTVRGVMAAIVNPMSCVVQLWYSFSM